MKGRQLAIGTTGEDVVGTLGRPPRAEARAATVRFRRAKARPYGLILVLVAVLLTVGYGEGLAVGVQGRLGLASPWVVMFPLLGMVVSAYIFLTGRGVAPVVVIQIGAIGWAFTLGLAAQALIHEKVYVAGYVQLAVFVMALALVRGLAARATASVLDAFAQAALVAHVVICCFVVAAWLGWQVGGLDVSIRHLIEASTPGTVDALYGFRPAGWSTEPAGAALAISASFTAVYYMVPSARILALGFAAAAALALQSATLVLFLCAAVFVLLLRRGTGLAVWASLALTVGVLAAVPLGWSRAESVVQGRDPSTMMRLASVVVGIDVVTRSFPIGVGYGNFQGSAVYGAEFENYLDLSKAAYYKTDVLLLNYVAELGLAGLMMVAVAFRLLGFGRLLLPTVFLAMQSVLSGTMLLPSLLVLAFVAGSREGGTWSATAVRKPEARMSVRPAVPVGGMSPGFTPADFDLVRRASDSVGSRITDPPLRQH